MLASRLSTGGSAMPRPVQAESCRRVRAASCSRTRAERVAQSLEWSIRSTSRRRAALESLRARRSRAGCPRPATASFEQAARSALAASLDDAAAPARRAARLDVLGELLRGHERALQVASRCCPVLDEQRLDTIQLLRGGRSVSRSAARSRRRRPPGTRPTSTLVEATEARCGTSAGASRAD